MGMASQVASQYLSDVLTRPHCNDLTLQLRNHQSYLMGRSLFQHLCYNLLGESRREASTSLAKPCENKARANRELYYVYF